MGYQHSVDLAAGPSGHQDLAVRQAQVGSLGCPIGRGHLVLEDLRDRREGNLGQEGTIQAGEGTACCQKPEVHHRGPIDQEVEGHHRSCWAVGIAADRICLVGFGLVADREVSLVPGYDG